MWRCIYYMYFGYQYVISMCVLTLLTRHAPHHIKWIVSAGLSQVSEFSFVLGSRARRLGLISREVRAFAVWSISWPFRTMSIISLIDCTTTVLSFKFLPNYLHLRPSHESWGIVYESVLLLQVYLLILGVTTLSLLFAPVLWKATVWKLRIRVLEPR